VDKCVFEQLNYSLMVSNPTSNDNDFFINPASAYAPIYLIDPASNSVINAVSIGHDLMQLPPGTF